MGLVVVNAPFGGCLHGILVYWCAGLLHDADSDLKRSRFRRRATAMPGARGGGSALQSSKEGLK
jgi:hypothetical protein